MHKRENSGNGVKVLYIAGWGRSGSTILSSILGQIDGLFSVGEIRYIWDRALLENRLCGCGSPFRGCPVWAKVLDGAFGGAGEMDVDRIIRLRESMRTRHLPLTLFPKGRRVLRSGLVEYAEILGKLYRAVQSTTGSKVIVDSSKFPSYAWALDTVPAIDLYVVHLVRDPRGVAYSWQRRKRQPDTEDLVHMESRDPVESSLFWIVWNLATETFWGRFPRRYFRLRYEDFVDEPRAAVGRILDLLQEEATALPFVGDREVKLTANHTVSGNPNRFQTGMVTLQPDVEWKEKMKYKDRALTTLLTWPLLLRYGYVHGVRMRQGSFFAGESLRG
jgi:sulfotransferase family protein